MHQTKLLKTAYYWRYVTWPDISPTFERRFCIAWAVLSSSSSSSSLLLHSQVDQLYFIIIIVSCHDVLERVHQLFHLWRADHIRTVPVPKRRRWQRLARCPMSSSAAHSCRCNRSLLLLCDIVVADQSRYRSRCSSLLRSDIGISY